jgi:hypothetical protein
MANERARETPSLSLRLRVGAERSETGERRSHKIAQGSRLFDYCAVLVRTP